MKTIPCPTCGRQLSRNASSCPACGHRGPFGSGRKVYQLVINVLGIVAVLVLVLLILMFAGY
jgi:hypothetical protein